MHFHWMIFSGLKRLIPICLMVPGTVYSMQASPEVKPANHVAGIVPAFNVTSYDTSTPLTSREKRHMALVTSIDLSAFLGAGVKSGVSQASNVPDEWDQDVGGFAKRFTAAFADGTSGKMLGTFVFPVLLHQDPRYFRKAQGGALNRLGYSVTRIVVTRSDSGSRSFNWSKSFSSLGSSTLSTLYYPHEDHKGRIIFANTAWSFGSEAATNVLKEFWPDIQRKVFGKP